MSGKTAVLYATCYLDVSGVTKINFDILKNLKQAGFDIHVCVTDDDSHLINNWDLFFHLYIKKPFKLRRSTGPLFDVFCDYLDKNNISCIYNTHSLWLYEQSGMLKKRFPHLKIVDSLHVLEPYCFRGGYPDISANRHIHQNIDRSILISEDLKKHIINNYDVDLAKLCVVRNGIDTDKFRQQECYKDKFKQELGLNRDDKLIGFVGRLTHQKRPLLFLETALSIAKSEKNSYFYMIGDGELCSSVTAFIAGNKLQRRVFHFGQRNDIDFVFNSTDILMQPSAYEGAPLTILEALATGVTVVSSDVGAIREYVGQCSVLVPRTSEAIESELFFAEVLAKLDSPADPEHGCRYVRENYDLKITSQQYQQILLDVLSG